MKYYFICFIIAISSLARLPFISTTDRDSYETLSHYDIGVSKSKNHTGYSIPQTSSRANTQQEYSKNLPPRYTPKPTSVGSTPHHSIDRSTRRTSRSTGERPSRRVKFRSQKESSRSRETSHHSRSGDTSHHSRSGDTSHHGKSRETSHHTKSHRSKSSRSHHSKSRSVEIVRRPDSDRRITRVKVNDGQIIPATKYVPGGPITLEKQHHLYQLGATELPAPLNDQPLATKLLGPYDITIEKEAEATLYYGYSRGAWMKKASSRSLKNYLGTENAEAICKELPRTSKDYKNLVPHKSYAFDLIKETDPHVDAPKRLKVIFPGGGYTTEEVVYCILDDTEVAGNPEALFVSAGNCENSMFVYRISERTKPGTSPILQVTKHIILAATQRASIIELTYKFENALKLQQDPNGRINERV